MTETVLAPTRPSVVSKKVLFSLLLIPVFLGGADTTLFNSIARDLPVLTDAWHLWFIDGYLIALASCIVLGSRLGARLGPGVTLAAGLFVFALAAASPAVLDSALAWTASRFIQGFGYALIISSVASVIGGLPKTSERTLGYSLWITTYAIGAGSGPLIGRALVDADAYTMLFWLPAAIALVCGVLATTLLRGITLGQASSTKVDVTSSALAFVGFGLFVAGLQSDGAPVVRLLATLAGCLVLAAFCTRQLRSRDPLIDVRMLSFSRLGAPSLALVVSSAGYTGSVLLFSAEADSLLSILPVSVLALWVSLGGYVFHKIQARFSAMHVLQVSLATCTVGLIVAVFVGLWPASILLGLGVGVSMAAGDAYLLGSVPPKDVARAAALQETALAVGAALGVASFGGILAATGSVVGTAVVTAAIIAVVVATMRCNRGVFTA